MRLCFDLDETLTIKKGPDYTIDSEPDIEAIILLNQLYDQGHTIIIHTARKMGTSNNNKIKYYLNICKYSNIKKPPRRERRERHEDHCRT